MILSLYLLTINPQEMPLIEAVSIAAPIQMAYDAQPEEIEAESTGGAY